MSTPASAGDWAPAPASDGTTTREVLLVESDERLIETVREMLEAPASNGSPVDHYRVVGVARFADAVERLEETAPAAAILGTPAAEPARVRELHERFPALPILVLVPACDSALEDETLNAGAQEAFAYESVDARALRRAIHRAILRCRCQARSGSRKPGERSASEERLRLLESAVEQASDAILICTAEADKPTGPEVVYVNPAFTRMSGYAPSDILEQSPFLLGGPGSGPEREVEIFNKLTSGETVKGEFVAYDKERREFIMEWQVVPLRDESDVVTHLVAVQRDVTEHRRLEVELRQSQKMEAVGRLAGGVAHDFNNLLTAIIGYNELLLLALGQEHPQREAVEQIGKAAKRAATLTGQLLAFSRRQVLQPKVIDLNEVVTGIETILRRLIGEDIDLEIRLSEQASKVRADPGQLEQVVLNLAINGRDAMPDGGDLILETGDVELEAESARQLEAEPGAYVRLRVRDSGEGMDVETKAKIFEPFFTTKGQEKGTGLGLATVYGIVKQSGGFIGVESEAGEGTVFDVFLPRIDHLPVQPIDRSYSATVERGEERVLLAEDDESVRRLVSTVLTENGYEVLKAANGEQALAIAAEDSVEIDLLISDVVMPDMRGPELCRRILAARPRLRTLFISGYADGSAPHRGEFGADAPFLQKPFSPEALARKVREVLDAPEPTGASAEAGMPESDEPPPN